jgi:hypothetical protein
MIANVSPRYPSRRALFINSLCYMNNSDTTLSTIVLTMLLMFMASAVVWFINLTFLSTTAHADAMIATNLVLQEGLTSTHNF